VKRNEVVYVIVVPVPNPVDANKSLRATIAFSARKRGSKRQTEQKDKNFMPALARDKSLSTGAEFKRYFNFGQYRSLNTIIKIPDSPNRLQTRSRYNAIF